MKSLSMSLSPVGTTCLIESYLIAENPDQTYAELLKSIRFVRTFWVRRIALILRSRRILKQKYEQKPQMSASHPIVSP